MSPSAQASHRLRSPASPWTFTTSDKIQLIREDDLTLCFLPMAHSFAQVIAAVWLKVGSTAAFVESIDKIVENAHEVRPTVMPSVPRIFEKAYDAVVAKGLATPGDRPLDLLEVERHARPVKARRAHGMVAGHTYES